MPRQKSPVTLIRDLVQEEVRNALQSLLGGITGAGGRGKTSRRGRKARGTWRPGGPGRPPKAVAARKRARKK